MFVSLYSYLTSRMFRGGHRPPVQVSPILSIFHLETAGVPRPKLYVVSLT